MRRNVFPRGPVQDAFSTLEIYGTLIKSPMLVIYIYRSFDYNKCSYP
nr:MAG TPA: hypothetical protein [Caudoviricetes sp.]